MVRTVEVYKGISGQDYYEQDMTVNITTGGNSAMCGIFMDVGEDYLIDLYQYESDSGTSSTSGLPELRAVGLCGLWRSWDDVDDDDLATLEEGCDDFDACEGECGEFQVRCGVI